MATTEKIIDIIYNCIDDINEQNGTNLINDKNTKLFGKESDLDSLGLVNLILNIEENINNEYNISISIVNEKAMSQTYSPFKSIDTLANYIKELIDEQ